MDGIFNIADFTNLFPRPISPIAFSVPAYTRTNTCTFHLVSTSSVILFRRPGHLPDHNPLAVIGLEALPLLIAATIGGVIAVGFTGRQRRGYRPNAGRFLLRGRLLVGGGGLCCNGRARQFDRVCDGRRTADRELGFCGV